MESKGKMIERGEVTIELSSKDKDVLLVLTHRKLPTDGESRISVLGGWHTHLDILIANLNGETPPNFWKRDAEMEAVYRQEESA
jgi:hypothetical protein